MVGAEATNQQEATDGQYRACAGADQGRPAGRVEPERHRAAVRGGGVRVAGPGTGPGHHDRPVRPAGHPRQLPVRRGAAPRRRFGPVVHRVGLLPGAGAGAAGGVPGAADGGVRRGPAPHPRAGPPVARPAPYPAGRRLDVLDARHARAPQGVRAAQGAGGRVRVPGRPPGGAVQRRHRAAARRGGRAALQRGRRRGGRDAPAPGRRRRAAGGRRVRHLCPYRPAFTGGFARAVPGAPQPGRRLHPRPAAPRGRGARPPGCPPPAT